MERRPVYGDRWSESCLERAGRKLEEVYFRTLDRKVTWSPVKQKFHPQEEVCPNVDFREAFDLVGNCLRQISRECHRYHANKEVVTGCEDCAQHWRRYHRPTPQLTQRPDTGNPFQKEETVHVTLPEGAYAITSHNATTGTRTTKMVQVADQGSASLHFTL